MLLSPPLGTYKHIQSGTSYGSGGVPRCSLGVPSTYSQANNKQASNKQANTIEQEVNNIVAQENEDNVIFDHEVTYQILQEMDSSILIHANGMLDILDELEDRAQLGDSLDAFGMAVMQVEACRSLVPLAHMALKAGLFDDKDDEEVVKQRQCICMYLASVGAGWMPK